MPEGARAPVPPLRLLHLVIGVAGLLAFVLTGQYMHWVHQHLQGMPDGPRLFYRSAHIYLMWAALLNLLLGCYLRRAPGRRLGWLQAAASLAIAAGPPLLTASFFAETHTPALQRPLAALAMHLALLGALAHGAVALGLRVTRRG